MFDAGPRGGRKEAADEQENKEKGMRYKVFIPTGEHRVFFITAESELGAIAQASRRDALGGTFDAIEYAESSNHDPAWAEVWKGLGGAGA